MSESAVSLPGPAAAADQDAGVATKPSPSGPRPFSRPFNARALVIIDRIALFLVTTVLIGSGFLILLFLFFNVLGNIIWSFAVLPIAIILLKINLYVYRFFRDHFHRFLVDWLSHESDFHQTQYSCPGTTRYNEIYIFEGKWRTAWLASVLILLLSGIGLCFVHIDIDHYFYALHFHRIFGILFFATYIAVLKKFVKIVTQNNKLSWLFALYPIFFEVGHRTPVPHSIVFIYNITIWPLFLFIMLMRNIGPHIRKDMLIWFAWFYSLSIVLCTGIFIITDPFNLRFEFVQRYYHGYFGVLFILTSTFVAFHAYRNIKGKKDLSYVFLVRSFAVIVLVSGLVFLQFGNLKRTVLESAYAANRYSSPLSESAKNEAARTLPPDALNRSAECRKCHSIAHRQWSVSQHAYAVKNKAFQTVLKSLVSQYGIEFARSCATCHEPALALSNRLDLIIDPAYMSQSEGVSCRACHFMVAGNNKNGVYQIEIPRVDMEFSKERRRDSFMKLGVLEHVSNFTKPFTTSGEVCYPCHSLRSEREGHELVPLDNVTSYLESSFAQIHQIKCQDCHMPRIEKDHFHYSWKDHRFFGGQVYLDEMALNEGMEDRQELEQMSKLNMDFLYSKLEVLNAFEAGIDSTFKTYRFFNYFEKWRQVWMIVRINSGMKGFEAELLRFHIESIDGNRTLELDFQLFNNSLGHDFPSSLFANIVQTWTELVVTDSAGAEIFRSGYVEDDLTHRLGRIEITDDGRPILPSESLEYNRIINMKFIRPDVGYTDHYSVPLPEDVRWPLRLRYALKFKRYSDRQVRWMSNDALDGLPELLLAECTTEIHDQPRWVDIPLLLLK